MVVRVHDKFHFRDIRRVRSSPAGASIALPASRSWGGQYRAARHLPTGAMPTMARLSASMVKRTLSPLASPRNNVAGVTM